MKLVSVIIPTYNRGHCVTDAIDSALGQTHRAVEVVVLDDGSTDGTDGLIAERYRHEPRVRYVQQANAGVVAARNAALERCTGDYVAFLDSDDTWFPWKLELQLAALTAEPRAGMVWTDMEAVDPDGRVVHARYLRRMYGAYRWQPGSDKLFSRAFRLDLAAVGQVQAYAGDIYRRMIAGNLIHTSTVLLTRRRLEQVGGFDPALKVSGEDYDFHLRTCREGPVAFLDVASIRYRTGMDDQLSRKGAVMAVNFLATISKAVDRDGPVFPRRMLAAGFGDAHRWLAETLIAEGDFQAGRLHYLRSLRHQPWQPRAVAQIALCSLPPGLGNRLRAAYGGLKALGRAVPAGSGPRAP